MTKRLSLLVTFDQDAQTLVIDDEALRIMFPDGSCWDDEQDRWVSEPELVDDVTRRLVERLSDSEHSVTRGSPRPVSLEARFVELVLNIIDPDGAWDPEETLEFGDAARIYLGKYPLSTWELEGAFNLAAQFVHDWSLGHVQVVDGTSYRVAGAAERAPFASPALSREAQPGLEFAINEPTSEEWLERTTLETRDPLSGTTLRMIVGEFEGSRRSRSS
ncbi:MAG: hypothetical protein WA860_14040 [Acidimicrobiales bacterium]